jgi:hypothetical protein
MSSTKSSREEFDSMHVLTNDMVDSSDPLTSGMDRIAQLSIEPFAQSRHARASDPSARIGLARPPSPSFGISCLSYRPYTPLSSLQ